MPWTFEDIVSGKAGYVLVSRPIHRDNPPVRARRLPYSPDTSGPVKEDK